MIFIASENPSIRLTYICEVIFSRILGTPHKVIAISEIKNAVAKYPAASLIYHSPENTFGSGSIVVPDEGLLSEENINNQHKIFYKEAPFLQVLFSESDFSGFSFGFDLFAASFYLLTEYEKYTNPVFDAHGRYNENSYELYKNHHHRLPLIHIYAEELWNLLLKRNPILTRHSARFDYTITFDIDSPYLYKGKPWWINFGGFIKDLLTFNFNRVSDRLATLLFGAQDPYDVYDYILEKAEHKKLIFFWLIDRNSGFDERHTYKNKLYQKLIRRMNEKQITQGLHPSYTAYKDKIRITHEKQHIELILGQMVKKARMHFLKYKLPETYQYQIEAGITDDYTACSFEKPGFKNFIAVAFPWFDLEKNAITSLIIHPTMIMDRTLQLYMQKNPEEAFDIIKDYINTTYRFNGHFVLLFHNNTLSEKEEWKGWHNVFEKTIQYLQERTQHHT